MTKKKTIGYFKYQGASQIFCNALQTLGYALKPITTPEDFNAIDALFMHGGESSVQYLYLLNTGLYKPCKYFVQNSGKPVLGVCAGAILLSAHNTKQVVGMGAIPMDVQRNGHGAQAYSGVIKTDSGQDVVFIRAPRFQSLSYDASENTQTKELEVLDTYNTEPIALRYGNVWVTAFHPEINNHKILKLVFG